MKNLESKGARIERANYVMGQVLDQRTGPTKRQPLKVENYDWDSVQSDLVSPSMKRSLRFVAEVEMPTRLYAGQLLRAAEKDGAVWLTRFVEETWGPEEEQHGPIMYEAAIACGAVSRKDVHSKSSVVDDPDFPLGRDYNSGEAVTFGWGQEDNTVEYYAAKRRSTTEPILRQAIGDVMKNEMFHHWIYSIALQFASPEEIVRAMRRFKMPGHLTSPMLQKFSSGWAKEFGFDYTKMQHTLVSGIVKYAGYEGLGEVVTSPAIRDGKSLPVKSALIVLDQFRHPAIRRFEGKLVAKRLGIEEEKAA